MGKGAQAFLRPSGHCRLQASPTSLALVATTCSPAEHRGHIEGSFTLVTGNWLVPVKIQPAGKVSLYFENVCDVSVTMRLQGVTFKFAK